MKKILTLLFIFALVSCGSDKTQDEPLTSTDKPTKKDIEMSIRKSWEKNEVPQSKVTINSIEIGNSVNPTITDVDNGIPAGSLVTDAEAVFIVCTYHPDQTICYRHDKKYKVFRDKFNKWVAMDYAEMDGERTDEPKPQ